MLDTLDLGGWFILRMASADTLAVVSALNRRGFTVWTPTVHKLGRMPRTRVEFDKKFPLMPTFAFVRYSDFEGVAKLAHTFTTDIPRFSIFRFGGGVPLVADNQLEALRREEARQNAIYERQKRRGMKGPSFGKGEAVKLPEGGFAGLSGTVEEQQGGFVLVNVEGFAQPIKIASILLESEQMVKAA